MRGNTRRKGWMTVVSSGTVGIEKRKLDLPWLRKLDRYNRDAFPTARPVDSMVEHPRTTREVLQGVRGVSGQPRHLSNESGGKSHARKVSCIYESSKLEAA